MTKAWIQTYPCGKFFPLDPRPEDVTIMSLARALSHICRFTGQSQAFYSVAEHSIRVSELCCPEHQLAGLLHDASEAYLSDLNSPTKHAPELEGYRQVEARVQDAIFKTFNVEMPDCGCIHMADQIMLATEARDLMVSIHPDWEFEQSPMIGEIVPMSPDEARQRFTERLVKLYLEHSQTLAELRRAAQ